jgi:hypothetical protein
MSLLLRRYRRGPGRVKRAAGSQIESRRPIPVGSVTGEAFLTMAANSASCQAGSAIAMTNSVHKNQWQQTARASPRHEELHGRRFASRIDQATFVCVHCGHTDNADVNAARNILQARALAVEPPKRTLRRVGKRKQLKQATHVAA